MSVLTVAYLTSREQPHFEWFFQSLARQEPKDVLVNVIDFHAEKRRDEVRGIAEAAGVTLGRHIEPMPNVWQGPHRLTQANYFAAANASNTAIAVCATDWIAFVDDLSCLMPGWLERVREAMNRDGITCGSYRKVREMEVTDGIVMHYKEHFAGNDSRLPYVSGPKNLGAYPCNGDWFYGCSFVARISDLLKTNGFDTDCDGMGYQDVVTGAMLRLHNVRFWFDPEMLSYESEEGHHTDKACFIRDDPGLSPNDKSHAILEMVRGGRKWAPNYYGDGGLAALRDRTLSGEPFPIFQSPEHEWFSGRPLRELP